MHISLRLSNRSNVVFFTAVCHVCSTLDSALLTRADPLSLASWPHPDVMASGGVSSALYLKLNSGNELAHKNRACTDAPQNTSKHTAATCQLQTKPPANQGLEQSECAHARSRNARSAHVTADETTRSNSAHKHTHAHASSKHCITPTNNQDGTRSNSAHKHTHMHRTNTAKLLQTIKSVLPLTHSMLMKPNLKDRKDPREPEKQWSTKQHKTFTSSKYG